MPAAFPKGGYASADDNPSPAQLVLVNASLTGFNPETSPLTLEATPTSPPLNPASMHVSFDVTPVAPALFNATTNRLVIAPGALRLGRHTVSVSGQDANGAWVTWQGALWFGSNVLTITALLPGNAPAIGANVSLVLSAEQDIEEMGVTDSTGSITFTSIPDGTLTVTVVTSDLHFGFVILKGTSNPAVTIMLQAAKPPANVTDLDFSNSTIDDLVKNGWEFTAGSFPQLAPHVENPTAPPTARAASRAAAIQTEDYVRAVATIKDTVQATGGTRVTPGDTGMTAHHHRRRLTQDDGQQPLLPARRELLQIVQQDLVLTVKDYMGPVYATYSFSVAPGATSVGFSYRFLTCEFPVWWSTQYDDAFGAKIISHKLGEFLGGGVRVQDSRALTTLTDPRGYGGRADAWGAACLQHKAGTALWGLWQHVEWQGPCSLCARLPVFVHVFVNDPNPNA